MPKNFWRLGILALCLAACGLATPAPTAPPPLPTNTAVVLPTATGTPTAAPMHTATKTPPLPMATRTSRPTNSPTPTYPPLPPQGPYLLADVGTWEKPRLVILGAEQGGRKELVLADNGYMGDSLRKSVSPDGKWLVYYTGTENEEPYDVTLNIFHLPDGRTRPVARLLSDGFPENLQIVAKRLQEQEPDFKDADIIFHRTLYTNVFAWSSDSRYLAFASQIGGGSSDLYIYDMQSGDTRRLTDDLLNVGYIEWSPDGSWISFLNITPEDYQGSNLHLIRPTDQLGQATEILKSGWQWGWGFYDNRPIVDGGWISPQLLWIAHHGDGGGYFRVEYLNAETKKWHTVWPGMFFSFAVDRESLLATISGTVDLSAGAFSVGTFLVSRTGELTKLTDETFLCGMLFRASSPPRFLVFDCEKISMLMQDGSMVLVSEKKFTNTSVSPDRRWFVLSGSPTETNTEMDVFSEDDQLVRSFNQVNKSLLWRPDSAGIFFQVKEQTGMELYYTSIPDGEPVLIDHCSSCDYSDLVWLP